MGVPRVPLELQRMIIEHLVAQSTIPESMQYRTVNSFFDSEILTILFTHKLFHRRFIKKRFAKRGLWVNAPRTLQETYLRYLLFKQPSQPSLWVDLVGQVANALPRSDGGSPKVAPEDLIPFCRHDFRTDWVIFDGVSRTKGVHVRGTRDASTTSPPFEKGYFKYGQLRWQAPPPSQPQPRFWVEEVEDGVKFVHLAQAICASDLAGLRQMLEQGGVDLKNESVCFGETVLEFALGKGSYEVLKVFLEDGLRAKWAKGLYEAMEKVVGGDEAARER